MKTREDKIKSIQSRITFGEGLLEFHQNVVGILAGGNWDDEKIEKTIEYSIRMQFKVTENLQKDRKQLEKLLAENK